MSVKTNFVNLFKIHRFNFELSSNGRNLSENNRHIGGVRAEFEMALDNLALAGESGDTLTFVVTKR